MSSKNSSETFENRSQAGRHVQQNSDLPSLYTVDELLQLIQDLPAADEASSRQFNDVESPPCNGKQEQGNHDQTTSSDEPNTGRPEPNSKRTPSQGKGDDKSISESEYFETITELKCEIFRRIKEEAGNTRYADTVIKLFDYVQFTARQLRYILSQDKILCDDRVKYPGQSNDDPGPAPTPYCTGSFRQGMPQTRNVSQRVPRLVQAVIDGYNETYFNLFRGNGVVNNSHIHTSLLKRYLSCLIRQNNYDAYSLIGQQWLNNVNPGAPVVLTGAFINSVLETYADKIKKLKTPVLAVYQHYSQFHLGTEYSYIKDSQGNVLGCSNEGKSDFWTDKELEIPYVGEWKGMNVETLVELGPQRICFINHVEPTPAVYQPFSKVDTSYKVKMVVPVKIAKPHLRIGLDEEEKDDDKPRNIHLVGYDPFLLLKSYTPRKPTLCERLTAWLKEWWEHTWLKRGHDALMDLLGLSKPVMNIVYNPNLCIFPEGEDDLYQLYYSNPIDPFSKLPYGVYYVDDDNVIQLHFGDPNANYTNLYSLFRLYAVRRGHSVVSTYKYLVEATCKIHPKMIPETDFSYQPTFESPLEPITARRPYKVTINEAPGYSVKLFGEQELRDYVVNYVTHRSVSAAASWRVVRAGLQNTMPYGTLLLEYRQFWAKMVCKGQFRKIKALDPFPNIAHFSGKKRRKYQRLYDTLGLKYSKARYSLFCKMEALPLSNVLRKAVRIISPNNPYFNLVALNFFLEFEETILNTMTQQGTHLFAKGLNYEERWLTIRKLAKMFKFCYSIDFKNFDAHHCDENYRQEIEFYMAIGLPLYLVSQLLTARHTGVISYTALMRCSGDLFTGSGNCLTVGALLFPFFGRDCAIFCDGDDTLVFLNRRSDYEMIKEHLWNRGYELGEPEVIPLDGNWAVPFCQMMYCNDHYTRDLERMLNKCGNLSGSNFDTIAKTVLGKIQSFPIISAHGIEFNYDLGKFVNGLDDDYETDYKKMLTHNMDHYRPVDPRFINLLDDTSLIARITKKFEDNKIKIFATKLNNRPKLLRRLIKDVLISEYNKQVNRTQYDEEITTRISNYIKRHPDEALNPVMIETYNQMIVKQNRFEIIQPIVP